MPRDADADAIASAPTAAATGSDAGNSPTLVATGGGLAPAGELDGRYRLGDPIGHGGMGEVRLAHDERVGRDVAVKRMRHAAPPPEAIARFLREARVQGRLDHPAVVPVHDVGVDSDGLPYFAMKRLAGTTLAGIIELLAARDTAAQARWPRRLLLGRLADVCLAVHFAHTRGVIHRDLKPHNIMLGDFGEVYVLDWGIAKVGDEASGGTAIQHGDLDTLDSVVGDTAAGAVLGTPGYMPPEQVRGGAIDARVDVYALGCVLFEILACAPAHPRGSAGLTAALDAGPLRPSTRHPDADIPPELDDACAAATHPDRDARMPSALELHDAIQRYLDGDRDVARRRELAAEHAAAAERALASGDAGRATAMHEAGRALALDPTHAGAQAIVARLLLEPPAETPPEVEDNLARERHRATQALLRAGAWVYLAYFLFVPHLWWVGVRAWTPLLALGALILINTALLWTISIRDGFVGRWHYVALACDFLLIGGIGIVYSPFLMLPGLAIASALAFITQPSSERHASILIAAALAMTVPIVLEMVGVLPRTFAIEHGAIVIRPWAIGVDAMATPVTLLAAGIGTLCSVAVMSLQLKRAQLAAERETHLVAWHLRQLVPDLKRAATSEPTRGTRAAPRSARPAA